MILDEFNVDPKTKQMSGLIEIVDGRWGASLAVHHDGDWGPDVPPLVLYDLWNDPYCRRSLHKERPDLVKKYTGIIMRQFREHRALAKKFTRSGEGAMNAEQIENLKSLGYIQYGALRARVGWLTTLRMETGAGWGGSPRAGEQREYGSSGPSRRCQPNREQIGLSCPSDHFSDLR